MKAHRPNYSALADIGLVIIVGFIGGVVFLLLVNAFRRYALDIHDTWWPSSQTDDKDHKALITLVFGAVPALAVLRFWLYRRWKWPPYDDLPK